MLKSIIEQYSNYTTKTRKPLSTRQAELLMTAAAKLRLMTSDEPEDLADLYPLEYEKHSEEKINAVKTLLKMLPGVENLRLIMQASDLTRDEIYYLCAPETKSR